MITCIVIIILAFIWLMYETDFLRVRLTGYDTTLDYINRLDSEVKEIIGKKERPVLTAYTSEAKPFQDNLKQLLKTELEIDGLKTKPKALKIGYGMYNAKVFKELINLIPADATLEFKSYPHKPAYKEQTEHGYIPHYLSPAVLECTWVNGSKGNWKLISGYDVKYYFAEIKDSVTQGYPKKDAVKVSRSLKYTDDNDSPMSNNGISLLAVEVNMFNQN